MRLGYQSRVLLGTRATQPTLPAGPTSTTTLSTVLYVDSIPHREKELASTSFGAFNSLSRSLRLSTVSQVWGRTGLKTRVMNNLLATFCLHFTRTFSVLGAVYTEIRKSPRHAVPL